MTRLADHIDGVPDVWQRAAEHVDQEQVTALVMSIASVSLCNRLDIATRQVAGVSW